MGVAEEAPGRNLDDDSTSPLDGAVGLVVEGDVSSRSPPALDGTDRREESYSAFRSRSSRQTLATAISLSNCWDSLP